jgi:GH25 family lysozyme M1 (1,4-beta-N-acetylmuramidase)
MNWDYLPAMWQYTESGSVPGIGVPVDLNLYFPPKE